MNTFSHINYIFIINEMKAFIKTRPKKVFILLKLCIRKYMNFGTVT